MPVAAMQPAPAPAPVVVEETRVAYADSATGEAFVADAITVTQEAQPPLDAPAAVVVAEPSVLEPVAETVVAAAPVTPPVAPSVEAMPSSAYPQGMKPSAVPPATPVVAASNNRSGLLVGIGIPALVVVALIILYLLGKGAHVGPLAGFFVASATATATLVPTATTAAATSTPTPAPTVAVPAPVAGFQTFQAPDGSYGLNYPSTWITTGQTVQGINAQAFLAADFKNIFLVAPTSQMIPPSSYVMLAQSLGGQLGVTNITATGQPTTEKLGPNTWHKVTGTLTYQGTPYTATILGNDRPAGTFVLVYLAPTASFAMAEKTDFLVMATSLTFGM